MTCPLPRHLLLSVLLCGTTVSIAQSFAAGGDRAAAAICTGGTVWQWGHFAGGPAGEQVEDLFDVSAISAGGGFFVALKSDSTLWAWGRNETGQLGNGTLTYSNSPVQVSGLTGIIAVSCGGSYTLALKADGTVWAWGYNIFGALGNGTFAGFTTLPAQVVGLTDVSLIAAGTYHCLALKANGTLWAWGYNGNGCLSTGDVVDRAVPVAAAGISNIRSISAGNGFSMALKNDGTVWGWGNNLDGELGIGTNTDSHVPVQVMGLSGITDMECGSYHTLALATDGTLSAWGGNVYGELGNASTDLTFNLPVPVATLVDVASISGGSWFSLARTANGTTWAWGLNDNGQLGNNAGNSNVPEVLNGLCVTIGIAERQQDHLAISVHPVPSDGHFVVDLAAPDARVTALEVRDVSGRLLLSIPAHPGQLQYAMDLSGADAGSYFVQVAGTMATARLVVR